MEARGFKILTPKRKENIVNVISNLELLPIAIYYLVVYGYPYISYALMLGIIAVGLIILSMAT